METEKKETVVPKKPSNKVGNYFKNLKNIRKNFTTVAKNPYAYQKFNLQIYKWLIIGIGAIIIWQFISIFRSYSAGSGTMGALTKAVLVIVGALIVSRLYGMYQAQKKIVDHYEASPTTNIYTIQQEEKKSDVGKDVDDILNKFDSNGKLKGGKK